MSKSKALGLRQLNRNAFEDQDSAYLEPPNYKDEDIQDEEITKETTTESVYLESPDYEDEYEEPELGQNSSTTASSTRAPPPPSDMECLGPFCFEGK